MQVMLIRHVRVFTVKFGSRWVIHVDAMGRIIWCFVDIIAADVRHSRIADFGWMNCCWLFERRRVGAVAVFGYVALIPNQVQYPGAERVMMSDLRNLKTLAWFLQKFELNFDILSSLKELSKQIKGEFDFRCEATQYSWQPPTIASMCKDV